jgi:hypothetical protein
MNFYELGEQLTNILKKVKPLNAWEENFGIEEITPEQTMINGKAYSEYKIYRGTFYPLSAGTIEIPSAELKMIKYKVAKNPSFFGQNTQQDFKSFTSAPKKVIVKDLPPHPLQGNIAVGNYRLNEKLEKEQTQTGKSVEYSFQIEGEGNISAINEPLINDSEHFDIYPPNVFQNIRRSGLVYGTKNFKYYLVPNEPGRYDLSNHLTWIFFNTSTYKYDTLKPKSHLEVSGESVVSKMVQSEEMTGLYANISNFDDSIQSFDDIDWLKGLISAFLVGVCGVCIFMFWRLKKKTKTKN